MKCPVCRDANLVMAERHGVEIDYCPECRGIWLDRGELDKILERSYADTSGQSRSMETNASRCEQRPFAEYHHGDHDYHHDKHHRRKSWLHELFD